jgi:hypothetical protein
MGTRKNEKQVDYSHGPAKPNNKLVSAYLKHFLCMDKPQANMDSQDSPRPRLRGSHHLPPYSILYVWPQGQHPNVILFRDSQVGSFEIPKIKTLATLEAHKFLCRPPIKMRYVAKFYPSLRTFQ